jgi:hypothetical protein
VNAELVSSRFSQIVLRLSDHSLHPDLSAAHFLTLITAISDA